MKLIHIFVEESKIKEISCKLNVINKVNNYTLKTFRDNNKLFYDSNYYKINNETDYDCGFGIYREMSIEKISPLLFPSKKDYYIETFTGQKKIIGVNTFAVQNKKSLTIISRDIYELKSILEQTFKK
tara:strand:+ start:59 stop:439 length:381 start_codon:yes stop_codon:yes gene_type:complete